MAPLPEGKPTASEGLGEVEEVISEIPDEQVKVQDGLPEVLDLKNLFGLLKEQVGQQNGQNMEKPKMKIENEKDKVDFFNIIIFIMKSFPVSNNRNKKLVTEIESIVENV